MLSLLTHIKVSSISWFTLHCCERCYKTLAKRDGGVGSSGASWGQEVKRPRVRSKKWDGILESPNRPVRIPLIMTEPH